MSKQHPFIRGEALPSWFVNALQEYVSSQASDLRLTQANATTVQVVARAPLDIAGVNIQGRYRYRTTTVQRTHPGGAAGTYTVWIVALDTVITNVPDPYTDHTVYDFDLRITSGANPAGAGVEIFEKIGEIDWDGAAITGLRQTYGSLGGSLLETGAVAPTGRVSVTRQGDGSLLLDLVDGGISTAKLADTSVTEPKLVTGAVSQRALADASVDSAALIDLAVITSKIADLSVTNGKLAAAAVDNSKLAAGSVSTGVLVDLAVTTAKIADLAVTGAKIANATIGAGQMAANAIATAALQDLAVTTAKINDLAVTAAKIANGTITEAKMGALSVGTPELIDLAVTTAKLANGSVTEGKMAALSVGTPELIDLSVTTAKLAAAAVTQAKIANLAVGTAQLADLAVTTAKLADLAVTGPKLAAGAVTPDKMAFYRGVKFASASLTLTTSEQAIAGLSHTAPRDGSYMVWAAIDFTVSLSNPGVLTARPAVNGVGQGGINAVFDPGAGIDATGRATVAGVWFVNLTSGQTVTIVAKKAANAGTATVGVNNSALLYQEQPAFA